MAWIKIPGKVPLNTNTIKFVNKDDDGDVYIKMGERLTYIEGISVRELREMIEEAEREERRKIFEENKDEIVDAVVSRLEEKMTTKIDEMMDGLADKLIEKAHLQKPSSPNMQKRSIPKVTKS